MGSFFNVPTLLVVAIFDPIEYKSSHLRMKLFWGSGNSDNPI
jgi:hypothetical protein